MCCCSFFSLWKVCNKYSQRKSSESRAIWGNRKGHWGSMMTQLPQVSSFSAGMWSQAGINPPTSPLSSLSALLRSLRRAAVGVRLRRPDQRGAEVAHPEAGARPEHRPGHVLPAPPRCRRLRGRHHGKHPRACQGGHCHVHRCAQRVKELQTWLLNPVKGLIY